MTADEMARGYLRLATARAQALQTYIDLESWASVVREAQEAVELFLKSALRAVGIEAARTHDVSPQLRASSAHFPQWFADAIPELAFISTRLAGERGASFYGDERRGIPPDALFDEGDATRASEDVAFVRDLCVRLVAPDATR